MHAAFGISAAAYFRILLLRRGPLSHDMTGNALEEKTVFRFHVSTSSGFHVGSLFAFFHIGSGAYPKR